MLGRMILFGCLLLAPNTLLASFQDDLRCAIYDEWGYDSGEIHLTLYDDAYMEFAQKHTTIYYDNSTKDLKCEFSGHMAMVVTCVAEFLDKKGMLINYDRASGVGQVYIVRDLSGVVDDIVPDNVIEQHGKCRMENRLYDW